MPAAPPPLRPPRGASVPAPAPLPSQPRPRGPQRRRLRELLEEGGAWLGGGHVASTGPGCSREEGAAAAAPPGLRFPGPGRDRERRVPGTGRARSGSGSAARRLGPHVTGGGAACSRHRPRGGRPVRGRGRRAGCGPLGGDVRGVGPGCAREAPGPRVWIRGLWLFVAPEPPRISFLSGA